MPKGQKTCPECQKGNAPRSLQCECGHLFKKELAPVAANSSLMAKSDPLDIKGSISSVKTLLSKISARPSIQAASPSKSFSTKEKEIDPNIQEAIGSEELKIPPRPRNGGYITYTPAGECPFKPEGFKDIKWSKGPYTDEIICNWAIKVYNSSTERLIYHPHAVVYWARYFWEMNDISTGPNGELQYGVEWARIKNLILDTLSHPGSTRNYEEDELFA